MHLNFSTNKIENARKYSRKFAITVREMEDVGRWQSKPSFAGMRQNIILTRLGLENIFMSEFQKVRLHLLFSVVFHPCSQISSWNHFPLS